MRPGNHAAADGSFGRSAGAAMGRGVLLLAVALLIGVVLLNATDDQPPGTEVAAGTSQDGGDAGAGDGKARTTTTTGPTSTTTPMKTPKEVKVIVANASGVTGAAGSATQKLKDAQYNALAPTNATKVDPSAVYFTAGFDREAAAVASVLGLPAAAVKQLPTPAPIPDLKTANVLVVLGSDVGARFSPSATTTTAPGATTTTAKAGATTTTSR